MANSEACRHCGEYETVHELEPEDTCGEFESEVEHLDNCPVIGCNGDCLETIQERDWRAKVYANWISNSWFMHRGQVHFVDLGS